MVLTQDHGRRKRRYPSIFQCQRLTDCSRALGCWLCSSSQLLRYLQQPLRLVAQRDMLKSLSYHSIQHLARLQRFRHQILKIRYTLQGW